MKDAMTHNFDTTPPSEPLSPEPVLKTPTATTVPRRKWLTPTLALIAVLVIGLFGGILIGHAPSSSPRSANAGGFSRGANSNGAGGAGFAGGGFTSGTIVSVTGNTMVVKAQDGTTKTVTATGTTTVSKTTKTTLSKLKAGQTVTVIGFPGSNGDIAATSVSEGANRRGFGARPGGTRSPASGSTTGTNG